MAIEYVGTSPFAAGGVSGASLNVSYPAGIQANDVAILTIESSLAGIVSLTGWDQVFYNGIGSSTSSVYMAVYTKVLAGNETTVTLQKAGTDHISASMVVYRGVNTSAPLITLFQPTWTSLGSVRYAHNLVIDVLPGVVLQLGTSGNDSATPQFTSGGFPATTVLERVNQGTTLGNGGGIGIFEITFSNMVTGQRLDFNASGSSSLYYWCGAYLLNPAQPDAKILPEGSQTVVIPEGVTGVKAEVNGGGGAGGGSGSFGSSSGGGGGAYAIHNNFIPITTGTSVSAVVPGTVTCPSTNTTGASGGVASFGTSGEAWYIYANGGNGGTNNRNNTASGGSATTGISNITTFSGQSSQFNVNSSYATNGGDGGGPTGGTGGTGRTTSGTKGSNGTAPGGGGGGGYNNALGGDGGAGQIILYYEYGAVGGGYDATQMFGMF